MNSWRLSANTMSSDDKATKQDDTRYSATSTIDHPTQYRYFPTNVPMCAPTQKSFTLLGSLQDPLKVEAKLQSEVYHPNRTKHQLLTA